MTVVAASQLSLMRERRQLSTALENRDWGAVRRLDLNLKEAVATAAEDPHRDMSSLLVELKALASLYRDVLSRCDEDARGYMETHKS